MDPSIHLRARGLTRRIEDRTLFTGVDLDVGPGLLWTRGPSGTGKSVLLRLLVGLLKPDQGQVLEGMFVPWCQGCGNKELLQVRRKYLSYFAAFQ